MILHFLPCIAVIIFSNDTGELNAALISDPISHSYHATALHLVERVRGHLLKLGSSPASRKPGEMKGEDVNRSMALEKNVRKRSTNQP